MWPGKVANFIERFVYPVTRLFNGAASAVLAAMMFLVVVDVTLRYCFASPIAGSYEIIELMLVMVVFLSIAYTGSQKGHIAVDMLISKVPPLAQVVIQSITSIFDLALVVLIAWQSVIRAIQWFSTNSQIVTLPIPLFPFVLLVALGCLLFAIVLFGDFCSYLAQLIKAKLRLRQWLIPVLVVVLIGALAPLWIQLLPSRMEPLTVGYLGLGVLVILLFSSMPVGLAMGLAGFLGSISIVGIMSALGNLGQVPFDTAFSYTLSVAPLFVLMGEFSFTTGLSKNLYDVAYQWLGRLPGGLAMATIGASAMFAAITGSSTASAATMGSVALPEMKRYKYDISLATGTVAAGGTLGILIPPSVILLIYGILTDQNIAKLFIAGIIPGIILTTLFMLTIYIQVKRNPHLAGAGIKSTFKEALLKSRSIVWVLVLFLLVIGGMYLGVFTPTEAGGIGAFGALVIGASRRQLNRHNFVASLLATCRVAGMIFTILIGAMIFGQFMAVARLPATLADFVNGLGLSPYLVLTCIFLVYLFLGCIMDGMAMLILTVPIFFPLIVAAGFDPIWFGIIMVLVIEMSMLTPPVGINVYVICGLVPEVPMSTIFRGVLPFLVAMLICFVIVAAFPAIATFLPGLAK